MEALAVCLIAEESPSTGAVAHRVGVGGGKPAEFRWPMDLAWFGWRRRRSGRGFNGKEEGDWKSGWSEVGPATGSRIGVEYRKWGYHNANIFQHKLSFYRIAATAYYRLICDESEPFKRNMLRGNPFESSEKLFCADIGHGFHPEINQVHRHHSVQSSTEPRYQAIPSYNIEQRMTGLIFIGLGTSAQNNFTPRRLGPQEWLSLLTLILFSTMCSDHRRVTVQGWQKALAVVCFYLPVMYALII